MKTLQKLLSILVILISVVSTWLILLWLFPEFPFNSAPGLVMPEGEVEPTGTLGRLWWDKETPPKFLRYYDGHKWISYTPTSESETVPWNPAPAETIKDETVISSRDWIPKANINGMRRDDAQLEVTKILNQLIDRVNWLTSREEEEIEDGPQIPSKPTFNLQGNIPL